MAKMDDSFLLEPPVVLTPVKRPSNKVQLPVISNRPKSTPEIGQRNANQVLSDQLLPPRIAFASPAGGITEPILSSRISQSATNSPEKSVQDDPSKPRISYALFERYRIEKKECDEKYQDLKSKADYLESNLGVAKTECEKLADTIKTESERIAAINRKIQDEQVTLEYHKERMTKQLSMEKDECVLLEVLEWQYRYLANITKRTKNEMKQMYDMAQNELQNVQTRNKAFEMKLAAAQKEVAEIMEMCTKIDNENAEMKKRFDDELNALNQENEDLTKNIQQLNVEIEALAENQTVLENQLSQVKQQMVSLASHLARNEQNEKRNKRINEPYPTGAVTVVFCDIEDAAHFWEVMPDAMIITVEIFHKILRDKLRMVNGYEVKSEGECFMASFSTSLEAVRWCHLVQESLLVGAWPEKVLAVDKYSKKISKDGRILFRGPRIRMGMHSGFPEVKLSPITGRADYYGPDINKAARVASLAYGGQVLISERVWMEIQSNQDFTANCSVVHLGKHTLRGVQEPEAISQILPKSLMDRTFMTALNNGAIDAPTIQERINSKRSKKREKEKQKEIKEEEGLTQGLVKEVSQLVQEIEAALKVHQIERTTAEDNPLKQKKRFLSERLEQLTMDVLEVRDATNALKKEKTTLSRLERQLKEELAWEAEQKAILEDKVKEFIRERLEKEQVLDKTVTNIETMLNNQNHLEASLTDSKRERNAIIKRARQLETEYNFTESKLAMMRERLKSLENELRKAEMYKELRGKYLKNLETQVAATKLLEAAAPPDDLASPSEESNLSNKSDFFGVLKKEVRMYMIAGWREQELDEEVKENVRETLMLREKDFETELDQIKMEKELYRNQVVVLEEYFATIDQMAQTEESLETPRTPTTPNYIPRSLSTLSDFLENPTPRSVDFAKMDSDKKEITELKEKGRMLQHQLTIVGAERDTFKKQLADAKLMFQAEVQRKLKLIEKNKDEIKQQVKISNYLRDLILNEFKTTNLKPSASYSKRGMAAEKKFKDVLDAQILLKLQAAIEKSIGNAPRDMQATHMEILTKVLKGEKVSPEHLAIIQPREVSSNPSDVNPIYKTVQLDASGNKTQVIEDFMTRKYETLKQQAQPKEQMKILGKRILPKNGSSSTTS